jgi:hypothetical protein
VREPWHAFAVTAVVGLGAAIVWPAEDALLATLVEPAQRSGGYAVHHALLNAGFGVGGVVAAVLVDASAPGTFELVYVLDGLSFLAFLPILLVLPAGGGRRAQDVVHGGFGRVLADRTFLRVWALTALLVAAGHAQALFLGLVACCGLVALGALRLERRLSPGANLVPALAVE